MDDTSPRLPRTTPLFTDVIMNPAVTAALFQTYARIYAAAWKHEYHFTDWMTLEDLAKMLGKVGADGESRVDRATIFRRLGSLRELGLIKWEPSKNRVRISILEVRPELVAKSHFCDPSSSSRDTPFAETNKDQLLLDQSQKCDKNGGDIIDRAAWKVLAEIGFGEPARSTLADMPHVSEQYVRAMAAQFWAEGFKRSDLGALKYRIENAWPAPDWCAACGGLDGNHASNCSTMPDERRELRAAAIAERIAEARSGPGAQSENEAIWKQALDVLKVQMTSSTFDTWLRRARLLGIESDGDHKKFTVECHNWQAQDWLSHRLGAMIARTFVGVVGGSVEVEYVVAEDGSR